MAHPKYPNMSIVTDLVERKRMVWFGIGFVSMHTYHMAYIHGQKFFCRVIFDDKSFTWTAEVGMMVHTQRVAHADRMTHAVPLQKWLTGASQPSVEARSRMAIDHPHLLVL